MGDRALLGVGEPVEHSLEHTEDLREAQLADQWPQGAPADVLHRDVGDAVVLEEVEQRHHVRVLEAAGQAGLAHEALGERDVVDLEIELLERHLAVERRLAGEVHDGHPATRQDADDLVAPYGVAAHRLGASLRCALVARKDASPVPRHRGLLATVRAAVDERLAVWPQALGHERLGRLVRGRHGR